MKVVKRLKRTYRVQVLPHNFITSAQVFQERKPLEQELLEQQSSHLAMYLSPFCTTAPPTHASSFYVLYPTFLLLSIISATTRPEPFLPFTVLLYVLRHLAQGCRVPALCRAARIILRLRHVAAERPYHWKTISYLSTFHLNLNPSLRNLFGRFQRK